jgi:hypothetical protein
MRFAAALLTAALLAAPAQAEKKLKDLSTSPEQLMRDGGLSDDDGTEAAVAAAANKPLGTLENPVRVGGPEGERAYIARLRCADGSLPKVGPRGQGGVGAFGSTVDLYPLDCGAAAPGRFALLMDPYHEEHREDRAPAGFLLER